MKNDRLENIIQYVREHPGVSSSEIITGLGLNISPATMRRDLAALADDNKLTAEGHNKGTRYFISPMYDILALVDIEAYFEMEIDERKIIDHYNFGLLETLADAPLFTKDERQKLSGLQRQFRDNISKLSPAQYKKIWKGRRLT